jgi:hypothetical protein
MKMFKKKTCVKNSVRTFSNAHGVMDRDSSKLCWCYHCQICPHHLLVFYTKWEWEADEPLSLLAILTNNATVQQPCPLGNPCLQSSG